MTLIYVLGQGRGGAGHLLLRGEEGWGGAGEEWGSGQYGLGALKVADLSASLATVSIIEQIGMDPTILPVSPLCILRLIKMITMIIMSMTFRINLQITSEYFTHIY